MGGFLRLAWDDRKGTRTKDQETIEGKTWAGGGERASFR